MGSFVVSSESRDFACDSELCNLTYYSTPPWTLERGGERELLHTSLPLSFIHPSNVETRLPKHPRLIHLNRLGLG